MARFDVFSVMIGSIAGGFFSLISTFANFSGFGIILSNVFAGLIAVYVSEQKDDYILIGGLSGIISSFIMLILAFILPDTPIGLKNLTIFGFIGVAISISGGGFLLGVTGGYISKKLSN